MIKYKRYYGNYADALAQLAKDKRNPHFAAPAEAMKQRIKQGVNSDICQRWAWYNASFNEVNGRILATKAEFNPLSVFDSKTHTFTYAQKAVDAMRTGKFYLTDNVLLEDESATLVLKRIAEQDANKPVYKKRVLDLGQTKTHDVPTDSFADDITIVFLAQGQENARRYGLFVRNALGENSVLNSKVYMQELIGKNKSRGFTLGRVDSDYGSDFDCDYWNLYVDDGSVFGGYESAKGTSQKISRTETLTQDSIKRPSLTEVLKYSRHFIASALIKEFEKGLREKYRK